MSEPRSWWMRVFQRMSGEVGDQHDLMALLQEAHENEVIEPSALRMMEGVLRVQEREVRDVMVPRAQMEVVEIGMPVEAIINHVIEVGHSRFPVIGEGRDNVQGILLAKDLLRFCTFEGKSKGNLKKLVRPATFIPESKSLDTLLQEFRTNRNHMAIVVDEYGGTAGLVTIEDVLEEIVGEIDDEYDIEDEGMIQLREDGQFLVNTEVSLNEFNAAFAADLEGGENLSRYLGSRHEQELETGSVLDLAGLEAEVVRVESNGGYILRVRPREGHGSAV